MSDPLFSTRRHRPRRHAPGHLPQAQDIDRRVRRRIEGALAAHLLAQPPPVDTMMAEGVRYSKGLREGEVPIEVLIEEHERLLGVPERIWV